MDDHVQRLVQALRAEKCPMRVLENVAARIAEKRRTAWKLAWMPIGFAVGLAALLAFVGIWRWPGQDTPGPLQASQPSPAEQADQARVVEEAGTALAFIGSVLLEAGQQTETILLEQAVPPLRSGFENAAKTITDRL